MKRIAKLVKYCLLTKRKPNNFCYASMGSVYMILLAKETACRSIVE